MREFEKGFEYFRKSSSATYGSNYGNDYILDIENAINNLTQDMKAFTGFQVDPKILKGYIAENWHSGTFNIDAALKGLGYETNKVGSNRFASPDISSNFDKLFSVKYYGNGKLSAEEQAVSVFQRYKEYQATAIRDNRSYQDFESYISDRCYNQFDQVMHDPIYSGQIRLIPKDQLEESIKWLERKILDEGSKRPEQVERYRETLSLLSDKINGPKNTSSIALSKEDAEKLAELAKKGEFNSADFGLSLEELIKSQYIIKQAINAGVSSAAIGMILKIAPEIISIITTLLSEKKVSEEDFKKLGFAAFDGATNGFILGSISASIMMACKSGYLGSDLISVENTLVATITVLVMDMIKTTYSFSNGTINKYEYTDLIMQKLFIATSSLWAGGISQSLIPIPFFGYMVGSFVGSILGAFSYKVVYKTYISLSIANGITFFELVDQNYTLPSAVLKNIGVNVFEYEKFVSKQFENENFEFSRFDLDGFKTPKFNLEFLRRGVIEVNRVGYI